MAPRSTKSNGDPENFARLVKVYSVLKIWDQKRWANMPAQPLQTSKVGRFDEGLVEGMRRWVRAGFDKDAVPMVLIALLTVNCERATDKASEERIRESMVRLSRVLDEYCVTGSSSVRHSFPLGKASKQAAARVGKKLKRLATTMPHSFAPCHMPKNYESAPIKAPDRYLIIKSPPKIQDMPLIPGHR